MKIFCLLVLLIAGIEDIKTREIKNLYATVLVIVKIIWLIVLFDKSELIKSAVGFGMALLISLLCFLIARDGIGLGDLILLGALGFFLGSELFLSGLLITSVMSCLFSIILLAVFKFEKKREVPFVPFIFLGNLVAMCLEAFC